MSRLAALSLSLAALTAAPAVARPPPLAQLEATRASTVAEQLVLCDIADQMASSPPIRNADFVYVRNENTLRFELALPPDYLPPSGWYDSDIERAYYRYRRAGLVQREQVRAARERYQPELRSRAQRLSLAERRFFLAQADFCRDLVRASRSL